MTVRPTPHRSTYAALWEERIPREIRDLLEGKVIAGQAVRVGSCQHFRPCHDEHAARTSKGKWNGWLRTDLSVESDGGRVPVEPLWIPAPEMTTIGTFIHEGIDHVPLIQLVPRPGLVLRSTVNESGTARVARIDVIPERGTRLRFHQKCDFFSNATSVPKLISLTNWSASAPRSIEGLKDELDREGSRYAPFLGETGRARFNETIKHFLGTEHPERGKRLTSSDVDAILKCLARALEEPDRRIEHARKAAFEDPADLGAVEARTIADQVADGVLSALSSGMAFLERQAKAGARKGEILELPALLTSTLEAFSTAALSFDGGNQGVVRVWPTDIRLRAPFSDSRIVQPLDQTNPLAEYSHLRKVTRRGPGGINDRYGSVEHRDLHDSQLGKLCPFETPESQHIGLNLHLARGAEIEGAQIVNRRDEPDSWLGGAASLIPFLPHNDAARTLMGAKNMKQAVPLVRPMLPLVKTGWEAKLAEESGAIVRATHGGVVKRIRHDPARETWAVTLRSPGRGGKEEDDTVEFSSLHPTAGGTLAGSEPKVKLGDSLSSGGVLAAHPATVGAELALGANLRVAYMPFHGLNFEDGIVVSERLVREDVLTSRHMRRVRIDLHEGETLWPGKLEPGGAICRPSRLDGRGIVRTGETVQLGDELVRLYRVSDKSDGKTATLQLKSRRARLGESGRVSSVVVRETSRGVSEIEIRLEELRPLRVGDKLMGRHGNKGVVTAILPDAQMPWIDGVGPVDVVLNPVGMLNRMNIGQLAETHVAWVLQHGSAETRRQLPEFFSPLQPLDRTQLKQWMTTDSFLDSNGKCKVRMGERGVATEQSIVVGYQYFLKLNHLADDKVVFRSVGNIGQSTDYGQMTLQPTRGRRNRGGQRVGEMEFWALAARNATTVAYEARGLKSDDVVRRNEFVSEVLASHLPINAGAGAHVSESWYIFQALLLALGFDTRLVGKDGAVFESGGSAERRPKLNDVRSLQCTLLDDDRLLRLVEERRPTARTEMEKQLRRTGSAGLPLVDVPSMGREWLEWWKLGCCGTEGEPGKILEGRGKKDWTCKTCGKPYSSKRIVARSRWSVGVRGGLEDPSIWGISEKDPAFRQAIGLIDLGTTIEHPITKGRVRYVPVPPRSLRTREFNRDYYLPVVRAAREVRRASVPGEDPQHGDDALSELVRAVEKLYDRMIETVGTKSGFLRQRVLGKRTDLSGRAVIVGDPDLEMDECGIPIDAAVEICMEAIRSDVTHALRAGAVDRQQLAGVLADSLKAFTSAADLQSWFDRHAIDSSRFLAGAGVRGADAVAALRELTTQLPAAHAEAKDGKSVAQRPKRRRSHRLVRTLEEVQPRFDRIADALIALGRGRFGATSLSPWLADRGIDSRRFTEFMEADSEETVGEVLRRIAQKHLDSQGIIVVLNRQPTLHRYGIMALKPRARPDNVIAISPLVCGPFNADFDGDTMALHLPATRAGTQEAWERLRPSASLRSAAAGQPLVHLAHEILAGLAYFWATDSAEFRSRLQGIQADRWDPSEIVDWAAQSSAHAESAMTIGAEFATSAGHSVGWEDLGRVADLVARPRAPGDSTAFLREWIDSGPVVPYEALRLLAWSGAVRKAASTLGQLVVGRGEFDKLGGGVTATVDSGLFHGLDARQLFASCYGARKSLADKKLLTPKAGGLTRLLVWAVGDIRIDIADCQTEDGIAATSLLRGGDVLLPVGIWSRGRTAAGSDQSKIRSPLTCALQDRRKVCAKCYGVDLSTGDLPASGWPAGIIAATTVGERGTQLAMRTFHTGGVAGLDVTSGFPRIRSLLLGRDVPVSVRGTLDDWDAIARTGAIPTGPGDGHLAKRMSEVRLHPVDGILRVFLHEMYSSYQHGDVDPRHFEVILAGLRGRDTILPLDTVSRKEATPFDAMAFGYARANLESLRGQLGPPSYTSTYEIGPATRQRMLGGR